MNRDLILAVDDDSDAITLMRCAFEFEAPDITVAYTLNGEEAIGYLQGKSPFEYVRQPPILLLLDLKMPRMDGFDVLKWLKINPIYRPKCIAVFSSSGESIDRERSAELGADYHFVKPVTYAELCDLVAGFGLFCRHVLARPRVPATIESPGRPSIAPAGGAIS